MSAAASAEIVFLDARRLAALLARRELSVVEVLDAFFGQIERLNDRVNAIVTLRSATELRAEATAADRRLASGGELGALHGLPMAIKDLSLTRGLRTTFGSLVYRDFVPTSDELYVERCRRAGAIIIGKTNTPEFGAGSQTFNAVFGATRNPYDLTKTSGGSTGGGAAALASGMLPVADGTDLGGSLRNPASFCNVVGFRPSPGRVPRLHARAGDTLGVHGPMARSVGDVAWLLCGHGGSGSARSVVVARTGRNVSRAARTRLSRHARCVEREPRALSRRGRCHASLRRRATSVSYSSVATLRTTSPISTAWTSLFQTLRAQGYAASHRRDLERHRSLLKDTVVWNIERGLALTE